MHSLTIAISAVLALGMAAQWLAWRLKLPSILLLLAFGFVAGRFIDPDELIGNQLLLAFVSLAVATILLEGGLSLNFHEIRDTRRAVFRLCTWGVAIAWVLTAVAAHYTMGLDWRLAALLGAILVVTGPTVIIPLLRQIRPARSVGAVAKWEGIVVDPIGAVLAVLVFQVALVGSQAEAFAGVTMLILKTCLVGGLGGFLVGKSLEWLFRKHLIPDFLHSPVLLVVGLAAYAGSNLIQSEVGLLTVTVLGITLGNQKTVSLAHILEFKENLRVLLISTLFIVLAARIELAALRDIGLGSLIFLACLIVVVRPASVLLSTFQSGMAWKHRLYLSLLAPRGVVAAAVTSVFALEILKAIDHGQLPDYLAEGAEKLVPLTFVVIIGTVAIYGLLAGPLARKLGLAAANPQGVLFVGAEDWVVAAAKLLHDYGIEVLLVDTSTENIARARMAGLRTLHANILSRFISEELDLFGIGRLVAVTPNFEVNTLACQEFIHHLGRKSVFQLRFKSSPSQRSDVTHQLRGRPLFDERFTHKLIADLREAGAKVKKTQITEKFSYADFQSRYGDASVPMFLLKGAGRLTVLVADSPKPAAGDTLISLIREPVVEAARPAS